MIRISLILVESTQIDKQQGIPVIRIPVTQGTQRNNEDLTESREQDRVSKHQGTGGAHQGNL